MLSQQLKELDAANLINRKEYQQIPPKIDKVYVTGHSKVNASSCFFIVTLLKYSI